MEILKAFRAKRIRVIFLALLKNYATTDKILFDHLNSPRAKNATYISPLTQNDTINVIGCDIILLGIVSDVKEACFFSILANEVSYHNVEHMPICLYVSLTKSVIFGRSS